MTKKTKKTVLKYRNKIPLIKKVDNDYFVLKGTRLLSPIKKYKFNDNDSKRYVILDCISKDKYVDNVMLGLYEGSFLLILSDLLSAGLIRYNYNGNNYGTNAFDVTESANKLLKSEKKKIILGINAAIENVITKVAVTVICKFSAQEG